MIRKLLICPWFGPLPEWMDLWERNVASLEPMGYDVLRVHDLEWFKRRAWDTLDIASVPIVSGEGKIHDFRCAFGVIFAAELAGYDYWGHTDFDCVYGRVDHFMNDTRLAGLDQWSNHPTYVSGPWSLYRNVPMMNELFMQADDWRGYLTNPETSGWVELGFSGLVKARTDIQHLWTNFQTRNLDNFDTVHFDGDRLMEGREEIMVAHWRRTKVYPENCR